MDASTAVILAAGFSALSAVAAAVITSRVAGRASKTNSMLEWAKQLAASEQAARKEAEESRERADRIRDEAEEDVARLRTELALRNLVGRPATGLNGR